MTVKQLKEILDCCNDSAVVKVMTWQREHLIHDENVHQSTDGIEVIFDTTGYLCNPTKVGK